MQFFLEHFPFVLRDDHFPYLAVRLFVGHLLVELHLHVIFADLQLPLAQHWQLLFRNKHVYPVFDVPLVVG